jgi:hypothetical protein
VSSPAAVDTGEVDAGGVPIGDAAIESGWTQNDAGFVTEAGVIRSDRFATKVVRFTPGECGGFGAPNLPGVVLGPPVGAGTAQGGLDVVSLGHAGEIVLSFEPNAIVDGPGVDFLVFENAFYVGGKPERVYAERAQVSVSEDGTTWKTFPCTETAYPYGKCAGWHPVMSNPSNGISPVDPAVAGGDPFDLADVGLQRARFVKILDLSAGACGGLNTGGFDLDAVAIVNAETP